MADAKSAPAERLLGTLVLHDLRAPLVGSQRADRLGVPGPGGRVHWKGSGYTLGLASGDLIALMNNITTTFDVGVATKWSNSHLS